MLPGRRATRSSLAAWYLWSKGFQPLQVLIKFSLTTSGDIKCLLPKAQQAKPSLDWSQCKKPLWFNHRLLWTPRALCWDLAHSIALPSDTCTMHAFISPAWPWTPKGQGQMAMMYLPGTQIVIYVYGIVWVIEIHTHIYTYYIYIFFFYFWWRFLLLVQATGGETTNSAPLAALCRGNGLLFASLLSLHVMESLGHCFAYTGRLLQKGEVWLLPQTSWKWNWPWSKGGSVVSGQKPPEFQSRLYL